MPAAAKYDPVLHVVLYQPEIPPNTGNVARSCVAIGAKLWLVKPLGFEITEKRLRRAGGGFWAHFELGTGGKWGGVGGPVAGKPAPRREWVFPQNARRRFNAGRF